MESQWQQFFVVLTRGLRLNWLNMTQPSCSMHESCAKLEVTETIKCADIVTSPLRHESMRETLAKVKCIRAIDMPTSRSGNSITLLRSTCIFVRAIFAKIGLVSSPYQTAITTWGRRLAGYYPYLWVVVLLPTYAVRFQCDAPVDPEPTHSSI